MNSHPSSASTRATVLVGGGAPATMIRVRPRPGISPSQSGRGVEHGGDDGRCRAHHGDAVLLDAAQDLGAVDLAQRHLGYAAARHRERHPPAVGVEHRQRVEIDVAVGHAGVEGEGDGVGPDVAVGDLDALGARGRAGGVVDRRRGVLVGLPDARLGAVVGVEVVVLADHEDVLGLAARRAGPSARGRRRPREPRSARRCTAPRRRRAGSSPAPAPGRSRRRRRTP